MSTFLLRCAGFCLLQAVLFGGLLSFHDGSDSQNYLAETVIKHRRLREVASPRVVLVGGSSLAVGVHSKMLEEALKLPVLNMGLAAGLGLEFMLSEVAPHLRRGDTVVLSLEYDHFARGSESPWGGGRGFDPGVLGQVLTFRPASVACFGWVHLRPSWLDRLLPLLSEVARESAADAGRSIGWLAPKPSVSSEARGFNRWGDHLLPDHLDRAPGSLRETLVADARGFPNQRALRALRRFVATMNQRGVAVFWSYPPKPQEALKDPHLPLFQAELESIPGLRILDRPEDHGYPEASFFDTANHLTSQAAATRTERWIRRFEDLQLPSHSNPLQPARNP